MPSSLGEGSHSRTKSLGEGLIPGEGVIYYDQLPGGGATY